MRILYVEPFLGGSHQQWIEGYQRNSRHEIEVIGLPDKFWKWRMLGGAVALADQFNKLRFLPDVIMVSDMLDLTTFKSLINFEGPIVLYFHENQITYPRSSEDTDLLIKRDNFYGFVNFTSALAANEIWFNSQFHYTSFFEALPGFLNQFPDYNLAEFVNGIIGKSRVMPLGVDLSGINKIVHSKPKNEAPVLLWNHRWEHDKNMGLYLESLLKLKDENIPFNLVALGEQRGRKSRDWQVFKDALKDRILHWGYVDSYSEYIIWLKRSDILPVTSQHDYFGVSVIEAVYAGCFPILPNALAYPEHILDEMKPFILYEKGTFYTRLKSVIQRKMYEMDLGDQQLEIQKYDWNNMAEEYDEGIEKLSNLYS